jgi:Tfp pilus assembly PilM family ATPase
MASNPLDRLLKPRFPAAAAGIEGDGASVVQLDRAKGGFVVKRAASVSFPAGVIQPGFDSTNISAPVELATALTDLITSAGLLRQRKWSTALPEASTRSAIITIEGATTSRREIEEVFEWKIERNFGAPSSKLRISREQLAPDAQKQPRYLVNAIRLSGTSRTHALVAVGGGPFSAQERRLIQDSGLEKRVVLIIKASPELLAECYSKASLFVCFASRNFAICNV